MSHLHSLAPGHYLLAHQAGASAVSCFTAAPDGTVDGQVILLCCLLLCAGASAVSCFKAAPDGTVDGQVGVSMHLFIYYYDVLVNVRSRLTYMSNGGSHGGSYGGACRRGW